MTTHVTQAAAGAVSSGTTSGSTGSPGAIFGGTIPTAGTATGASAINGTGTGPIPEHNSQVAVGAIPTAPAPPGTPINTGGGTGVANFGPPGNANASVHANGLAGGTFGFASSATTALGGNATGVKCAGSGQSASASASPAGGAANTMGSAGANVQMTIHLEPPGALTGTAIPIAIAIGGVAKRLVANEAEAVVTVQQAIIAAINAAYGPGTAVAGAGGTIVVTGASPMAVSLPSNTVTVQITCP